MVAVSPRDTRGNPHSIVPTGRPARGRCRSQVKASLRDGGIPRQGPHRRPGACLQTPESLQRLPSPRHGLHLDFEMHPARRHLWNARGCGPPFAISALPFYDNGDVLFPSRSPLPFYPARRNALGGRARRPRDRGRPDAPGVDRYERALRRSCVWPRLPRRGHPAHHRHDGYDGRPGLPRAGRRRGGQARPACRRRKRLPFALPPVVVDPGQPAAGGAGRARPGRGRVGRAPHGADLPQRRAGGVDRAFLARGRRGRGAALRRAVGGHLWAQFLPGPGTAHPRR